MLTIPPSLSAVRQFILYTVSPSATRPGKTDKFPIHPVTGRKHDAHNPAIWLSADEAIAALAAGRGHGVGLVFTEQDDLFFLDIDDALHDGQWSPLAQQICQYFAGCFIEVSFSGQGLHIIGRGKAPAGHACKYKTPDFNIDLYTEKRFAALTGFHAVGDPMHDAQSQLDWMVANYFPVNSSKSDTPAEWSCQPDPEYTGPTDDADLIKRMLASKSTAGAFNGRASVNDLWTGNVTALSVAYPSESDISLTTYGYDHSSADAALCQHLAFWTGRDCERMDRLFRQSALYRDKWENRAGYRQSTVLGAVSRCQSVYSHFATLPALTPTMTPEISTGNQSLFENAAEFLTEFIEIEYLVQALFELYSLISITGPSGQYKSFVAVCFACCVATGRPWNGREVKRGAVLYLAGEGRSGIKRRVRAWRIANDLSPSDMTGFYLSKNTLMMDGSNICQIVTEMAGVDVALIVVDTMARHLPGDENSTKDMGSFVNHVDKLKNQLGAAAIVVHHTGHDQSRGRGSSAYKAALDVEILCDQGTLTFTKMKDDEAPEPMEFKLLPVHIGFKKDGSPISSCVIAYGARSAKHRQVKLTPAEHDILVKITDNPGTEIEIIRTEYYERVKIFNTTTNQDTLRKSFSRALKGLVDKKQVFLEGSTIYPGQPDKPGQTRTNAGHVRVCPTDGQDTPFIRVSCCPA